MIFNPVVAGKSGGSEPQWQKLNLGGTNIALRAGFTPDPMVQKSFEIQFERLPVAILWRVPTTDSAYEYSVSIMFSPNEESYSSYNKNSGSLNVVVDGTTVSGIIGVYLDTAEFLPIYE